MSVIWVCFGPPGPAFAPKAPQGLLGGSRSHLGSRAGMGTPGMWARLSSTPAVCVAPVVLCLLLMSFINT